jgi:HPt (histidine-containing phosphotransfer) domain-containing protein
MQARSGHILVAMSGDRERCLAAGMNDYVAKPIRVDELVAAIKRAPRRAGGTDPVPDGVADHVSIDMASLDRVLDGTGGDTGFVGELIVQFLSDASTLIDTARSNLAAGDADEVRRAAHTLKSNAATFGAQTLAQRSRQLEESATQGTLEGANKQLDLIAEELTDVRHALPAAWDKVIEQPVPPEGRRTPLPPAP